MFHHTTICTNKYTLRRRTTSLQTNAHKHIGNVRVGIATVQRARGKFHHPSFNAQAHTRYMYTHTRGRVSRLIQYKHASAMQCTPLAHSRAQTHIHTFLYGFHVNVQLGKVGLICERRVANSVCCACVCGACVCARARRVHLCKLFPFESDMQRNIQRTARTVGWIFFLLSLLCVLPAITLRTPRALAGELCVRGTMSCTRTLTHVLCSVPDVARVYTVHVSAFSMGGM